ncbi:DUF5682 family protein [Oricola sp.]|uniref:DUF5682 family protein n=1 Tax=Oricola sp. TaxID=1979950 RepID=UPI0025CEDC7A|nr:DUF5682 family protein [Oricola sp.]MCI5075043.1 DUF5682 family protein [Oricola sp.]
MSSPRKDSRVTYFGVRHHGPGSARQLLDALESLQPEAVLIEGPSDASPLIDYLADDAMKPPVALLCYPKDTPSDAAFWPFAVFSPEYQAARWALANGRPVRFIDLPFAARFPDDPTSEDGSNDTEDPSSPEGTGEENVPLIRDPIGALADAAGYEDGESWWSDIIEENPSPGPVFEAIGDAMTALREGEAEIPKREMRREAHMRLEIAAALKEFEGAIAVVCGAWHVPALRAAGSRANDRQILKGMKKQKLAATWAPWTSARLAFSRGYGAGVAAPGWCLHIWQCHDHGQVATRWLARIAATLRARGHIAPTASLIEAERLAITLAAIRERPNPGFEELRDAAVACLFHGEASLWNLISDELLIGWQIGEIPNDMPLAPLLEDLQRQQKATRLKPEELERELSVDLRSESGLARSTLLHRLNILDVPWGTLADAGRSRGTFREKWALEWNPEYSVRLVENLVYGPTIEKAAASRLADRLKKAETLSAAATGVYDAITANLDEAVATGLEVLEEKSALASDCLDILRTLPPLGDTIRYGHARSTALGSLPGLMARLVTSCAVELDYAGRDLDADASGAFAGALRGADAAVRLVQFGDAIEEHWRQGLERLVDGRQTSPMVRGKATQLLYEAGDISGEDIASLLARHLSPGTAVADAAAFFEGFFDGIAPRLIHDAPLRESVDEWICGLDDEAFTASLPLLRRVFSNLDRMERRRMLDAMIGRRGDGPSGLVPVPGRADVWELQMATLNDLFENGGRRP